MGPNYYPLSSYTLLVCLSKKKKKTDISLLIEKKIYLVSMIYEGWIDSWFIYVYNGIFVILQGCTRG